MINIQLGKGIKGAHGEYIKLSRNVGVKIIHSKPFKTIAKAHNSQAYKRALEEVSILECAKESGVVPLCYGVSLFNTKEGYRVGVLLQHLGSVTLEQYMEDNDDIIDQVETIHEALAECGIEHNDLHATNILVYKNKLYAIDFSPESVYCE